jgi:hypothetical protein
MIFYKLFFSLVIYHEIVLIVMTEDVINVDKKVILRVIVQNMTMGAILLVVENGKNIYIYLIF